MTVKVGKNRNFDLDKIMMKLWGEFVYSSNLVALGDIIVMYTLSLLLNIDITLSFLVVIYLSILAINYFNRYKEADIDLLTNSKRLSYVNKYLIFTPYIMGTLIIASVGITAYYASNTALVFMLILLGQGILYTLFLKKITKKITGFKNFMTALPYGLLVLFLAFYHNSPIVPATYLVTIFYFLRIFINTTYFDIKDIESDRREGLKTFSVVYGEDKTKKILMMLNFISTVPILLGVFLNILPLYSVGLLMTVIYAFIYLGKNKTSEQDIHYNVIVDSEFIFWLPYIIIFKAIVG